MVGIGALRWFTKEFAEENKVKESESKSQIMADSVLDALSIQESDNG